MKLTPDFDATETDFRSFLPIHAPACPPLSILKALREDCLPQELADPAREHLSKCPLCKGLLADFETLPDQQLSLAQQKHVAASLPTTAVRTSFWSSYRISIGVAAALVIMAGLFFSSYRGRNKEVAGVKPPPDLTSAPIKEIEFAPLAPPSGSAVLLTRGSGSQAEPANEELLPAFRAYNHADYAVASQDFENLSARYPQSQLILLYLGVSQLALHQDAEARTTLLRARESSRIYDADATEWYAAVAAARLGFADTRPMLEELCQKKSSAFSERSCQALPSAAGKR